MADLSLILSFPIVRKNLSNSIPNAIRFPYFEESHVSLCLLMRDVIRFEKQMDTYRRMKYYIK